MGIELIVGIASAVIGGISAIAQGNAAAASAREQREARRIQSAQNQVRSREDRRQRIREERIRRAQILQSSQNQGTSRSSGEVGAIGALSTNLAGLIGTSLGESAANRGINAATQRAADAEARGNAAAAWGDLGQSFLKGINSF